MTKKQKNIPNNPAAKVQSGESIANRAMLCSLSITLPGRTKTDKAQTSKLSSDNNAAKNSAKVQKNLWAGKSLTELVNHAQTARNWFYGITSPWGDEGTRILSNELYFKAAERFNGLKESFIQFVNEFADTIEHHKEIAREQGTGLGNLFREEDYPTREQVLSKCSMSFRVYPLNISDWRISTLNDGEKAELEKQNEELLKQAEIAVKQDLVNRLAAPLKHLLEKVSGGEKGKLHKSLLVKVREAIELAGLMNVSADSDIKELCREIDNQIAGMSVESMRDSSARRAECQEKTQSLLDKLAAYGV